MTEQIPNQPLQILNSTEAARVLNASEMWIKRNRASGNPIPHFRIGRNFRYRLSDIEAWIEAQVENVRAA